MKHEVSKTNQKANLGPGIQESSSHKALRVTSQAAKYLNERVRKMILSGHFVKPIKVGWSEYRVYWVQCDRHGVWRFRSGRRFPNNAITPKELDVDLGMYSASLSGIIPYCGTVSSMM